MDVLIQHGVEARTEWEAYFTTSSEVFPRYHNRPDCEDGSQIDDKVIRAGTADRPLCDKCTSAQKSTR